MKNTFMLSWFARLTGKHSTTDVDNMPVSRPISGSGIPPALVWQVLHGLTHGASSGSVTCPVGVVACPCKKPGTRPAVVFSACVGPGVQL